jgi:hypothetical protein
MGMRRWTFLRAFRKHHPADNDLQEEAHRGLMEILDFCETPLLVDMVKTGMLSKDLIMDMLHPRNIYIQSRYRMLETLIHVNHPDTDSILQEVFGTRDLAKILLHAGRYSFAVKVLEAITHRGMAEELNDELEKELQYKVDDVLRTCGVFLAPFSMKNSM